MKILKIVPNIGRFNHSTFTCNLVEVEKEMTKENNNLSEVQQEKNENILKKKNRNKMEHTIRLPIRLARSLIGPFLFL